jgi:ribA/ribD-fused uncharacterized protein|nr:MAG TPA: protein of unknown function (DUF1768) [Caudoviricetes sp.]
MYCFDEQNQILRTDKYTFFLRGVLSQWHRSPFMCGGVHFPTCEHFMMFQKATIFGDMETAAKIIDTPHPREAKELGRRVRNFNQKTWEMHRQGIVISGNYLKFNMHTSMREVLLSTEGTLLVEANKYDSIWGIGMSIDDPAILDRRNWRGENLLGWSLTQVRETLLFKRNYPDVVQIPKE